MYPPLPPPPDAPRVPRAKPTKGPPAPFTRAELEALRIAVSTTRTVARMAPGEAIRAGVLDAAQGARLPRGAQARTLNNLARKLAAMAGE
jgi:hypothetical protein